MLKTNITNIEKVLLRGYVKASPLVLIRFKSQAVLMAGRGMQLEDIEDVIGRKQRTIVLWIRDFNYSF